MSHQPERKEKDCLNCGTEVLGRFCHNCGQENIIPHQNFLSLAQHFLFDIFHFDGKFFLTLGYLFSRPGFVAKQYVQGKRMRFLDPIRMYLFTSAVFFLVFFSINGLRFGDQKKGMLSNRDRMELAESYKAQLKNDPSDTALLRTIALLKDTSREVSFDTLKLPQQAVMFKRGDKSYKSVQQYDSIQKSLPDSAKDGWMSRVFARQSIKANEKYGDDGEGRQSFLESFVHKLPYLLFVSLPFFALILKLLYARRKNFYYSDHAIFTLYHYILSFLVLLIIFGIKSVYNFTHWKFFDVVVTLLYFAWPVYLYIEMKNFYQQSWRKTFVKFLILNMLGLAVMILLFFLFLLLAFFQL